MIYFDTSALVKLVRHEAESGHLVQWLAARTGQPYISSVLIEVEVARAMRQSEPHALASVPRALAKLSTFEFNSMVRATAAAYQDPVLPTSSAIHLATAQILAADSPSGLSAFLTYDKRLFRAAQDIGLPAASPGRA